MTIRDFYNFIEHTDIDLDCEISVFVKDDELCSFSINDIDYVLRDVSSNRIILTSKYLG